jgi:hypothetical protein
MGFELEGLNVSDLNNKALTVLISYMSTGEYHREIIAEIPAHVEIGKDMLLMLSGCKTSISLIPPKSDDDSEWTAYEERLKAMFAMWLSESSIARLVYPLVGYFEYLVLEANGLFLKQ